MEGISPAALLMAAENNDLPRASQLLADHPDLVGPSGPDFRDSSLHRAVLGRHAEMTRLLMQFGADARVGIWPHRDATSAYAIAFDRGYSEIVAVIEREEDLRRRTFSHGEATDTPAMEGLQQAILHGRTREAISQMEANPALVHGCDIHGVTPLHVAAWKHDVQLVGWLLDHGASPHAGASRAALCGDEPRESNRTPLDFAAIVAGWPPAGRQRSFYFMENANVDPARFHETADLLLHRGAEWTPRAAVALGEFEVVARLNDEGRLKNEIQLYRGGLLAIAVRVNRLDMVARLLDLGLDPNERVVTREGERSSGMPLWFASLCGRLETAEMLLKHGADANAVVFACGDPLGHCAAGDEEMEALLRRHGAGQTVEQLPAGDEGRRLALSILNGETPASSLNVSQPTRADLAEQMLWATDDGEIVRLCLRHTTRPHDDPWWNDVLIQATSVQKLKVLLESGIDPDVIGDGGFTLLHHLAASSRDDVESVALATLLLDAGASLSVRDHRLRSTPLGWACRWGRLELVQLYLSRGADVHEPDAESWATPLAWANKRGYGEIAQHLREHGATT